MLHSIPQEILIKVDDMLGQSAVAFDFIGGGCINDGGKLTMQTSHYFIKWNDVRKYPGMFATEARGLKLLSQARSVDVAHVVADGTTSSYQFLILELIEGTPPQRNYWEHFGRSLARLHRETNKLFGLDHDNYIGSLQQSNRPANNWVDFFINERLEPQLRHAVDAQLIDKSVVAKFQKLYGKLTDLLPAERPSLLHGDLWSGNLMRNNKGLPCLIDPSVYYGHREVDLAMTQLFGGFDPAYFDAYEVEYPLIPGFKERFPIYNLYPLLVHVNLFGGSYVSQLVSILSNLV